MLVHLDVSERRPVLGGRAWGATGAYEQIEGRAHFTFDPQLGLNAPVVDLRWAPRSAQGLVECRADFWMLKPVQASKGSGHMLYYVVNRGRKGALSTFNIATASNRPETADEFGDGLLMEHGFTVAACAWQADVPPEAPDNPHLMTLDAPTIEAEGPISCEIVVDEPLTVHSLGSRYHRPYEVAAGCAAEAELTVRSLPYDTPEPVARQAWSFTQLEDGRPAVEYAAGFEPGLIYNLVYTACQPAVMGIGMAATRDFVTHIKSDDQYQVDRAYGFGSSQSGRFLRQFLYEGFNESESRTRVFDGLQINVAGAGRGSFNHRFAQPSRHASAHFDVYYPTEEFPFADAPQQDGRDGRRGGLFDRALERGVLPKVFHVNSSTEYWNRGAALTHVDVAGERDLPIHDAARIYHFASTQHGADELPQGREDLPGNPVEFKLGHRALLLALSAWVQEGREPPPSCYPTLADGTLVDPQEASFAFPPLSALGRPAVPRIVRRSDFGHRWSEGIIDEAVPALGAPYPTLVPAVDADGNEVKGIRLPEVAVPLGTFVGWRLRTPEMGASWALVGLSGAWLPFAARVPEDTDPRLSIADRYTDVDEYAARCTAAACALVAEGYLLQRDVARVHKRAAQMYEWATNR